MCSLFFSKRIMLVRPCNGMSTCYLCQMTDLCSLKRGHLFKALVLAFARKEGRKEGRKGGREGRKEGEKGGVTEARVVSVQPSSQGENTELAQEMTR